MNKFNILSLFIAVILGFGAQAQKINEKESIVTFSLINRGSEVTGTIGGMKGEVVFDKNNLDKSSFKTSIDPNTINTNNGKRDAHLKNPDFFEIETFPTIDFTSSRIELNGDKYVANGELSMHGISKDVSIEFTATEENGTTTLKGTLVLDHADYGIGKNRDVTINITCVVSK